MKKMLFIASAVLSVYTAHGMEIKDFTISPVDIKNNAQQIPELAELNRKLLIKEIDTNGTYYSPVEFCEKAFGLNSGNLTVDPSGNSKLDNVGIECFASFLLTENGKLNSYLFFHKLLEHRAFLQELFEYLSQEVPEKFRENSSGSILQYVAPTVKYSTAFFGGIGALALYQWYRAR